MNFFDCWKTLNTRFDEGDMTAQTQLVGYKLFAIFNERMFPEWLPLTDRELQSRTNIRSGQTIVEARRQLKNAGLIDFKTAKNKPTQYRLTIPIKHESSTNQAPDKHESSTGQAPGFVPYTRVREDVKTLDLKTSSSSSSTGARDTSKLDTLLEYWERDLRGGRLSFEQQGQIAAWLEQHGYEWLKAAMREASDANGNSHGLNFKLLRAVIDRKLNPPQKPQLRLLKGGEKSGGQSEYRYEPLPASTGNEPWAGY